MVIKIADGSGKELKLQELSYISGLCNFNSLDYVMIFINKYKFGENPDYFPAGKHYVTGSVNIAFAFSMSTTPTPEQRKYLDEHTEEYMVDTDYSEEVRA